MSDVTGRQLGSYEVKEVIGTGGMASVYRARQVSLQRDVALKIIRIEADAHDEFILRFEREGRVMQSLNHANIVKTYEFGKYEDRAFIAMELLTGGSLSAQLALHTPLPLDEVERYMGQIASALTYAHKQSIVHRDLKPSNILFNTHGAAILTDFGVAKVIYETTTLTKTGMIVGTPPYMPPEQWRGEQVDARADIYALGVLLYQMLTGYLPFWADTPVNLMYMHMQQAPPSVRSYVPDAPEQIDWVVFKALAKNRSLRFASADDLYTAFRAVLKSNRNWLTQPQSDPSTAKTQVSQPTIPFQQIDLSATAVPVTQDDGTLYAESEQATALGVTPEQQEQQEKHALQQLEAEMREQAPRTQTRTVNVPPIDTSTRFIGRDRELSDIMRLISDHVRLVGVYGRGGVGKTALVCRALSQSVALHETAIDGLIYLSMISTGISLDRIIADIAKLLPEASAEELQAVRINPQLSVVQKTTALLDLLGDRRFLLLLDNMETLQDSETGLLTDADIQTFIETVVRQGKALILLVTSRLPLTLPLELKPQERLVPLEEGLPSEEGVAFLRANDVDGAAGLRDAAEQKLVTLVEKVRGFPRALEAIIGRLLEDQLLTIDELIASMSDTRDGPAHRDEITPLIVKQAIDALSADALRVMECLAVYEYPVGLAAIEYLLAPYMQTSNLRTLLNRLLRTYFVGFNKAVQSFNLHSIDRAYCIDLLLQRGDQTLVTSINDRPAYTYKALNLRAADFCVKQRKPEESLAAVEDIVPQLNEFEYRLRAADFDQAAEVLLSVDFNYLMTWGQFDRVVRMHRQLSDKPLSPSVLQRSLSNLGTAISYMGEMEEAVRYHEQALEIARQIGDRTSEAQRLRNLGMLYVDLNKLEYAKQLAEQSIALCQELNDVRGAGVAYNVLGVVLDRLSELTLASDAYQKAIEHFKRVDEKRFGAAALGNLASVYLTQGKFEQAEACYLETEKVMREINDTQNRAVALSYLGRVYNSLGQINKALSVLEESIVIFGQTGSPDGASLSKAYLASTSLQVADYKRALDHAYDARQTLGDMSMPRISTYLQGLIAATLLYLGDADHAEQEILAVPLTEVPDLEYEIMSLRALISLRRGNTTEAAKQVEQGIQLTTDLLVKTPDQYDVLFTRGLMFAEQALLTKTEPTAAIETYQKALAVCSATGIVTLHRLRLDALMKAPDGNHLAAVRSVLPA